MKIKSILGGDAQANCYLLIEEDLGEVIVIDPAAGATREIAAFFEKNHLRAAMLINTHAHIDHIGGNNEFTVPLLIHHLDKESLADPAKNLSQFLGGSFTSRKPDRLLKEADEIRLGKISLLVIHTPGHTPGSISLKTDNILFTGDTLFSQGIGRTDFPGGDDKLIVRSIREKLLIFPEATKVFPGHGPSSSLKKEKKLNPYL